MRISIIGSGNVAWHMARRLSRLDHSIEILHRNPLSPHWSVLPSVTSNSSTTVTESSDLTIIAVSDRSIAEVISTYTIPVSSAVVHTSGAVTINLLETAGTNAFGVLYPLQSLTAGVDVQDIPLLLEGNNQQTTSFLQKLANQLSTEVRVTNSIERKRIHAAAVFTSNFVNHLWGISDDILADLPLSLLKPLAYNTLEKAFAIGPKKAQTGPAIRKDTATMEAHLDLLDTQSQKLLYIQLSESIQKSADQ